MAMYLRRGSIADAGELRKPRESNGGVPARHKAWQLGSRRFTRCGSAEQPGPRLAIRASRVVGQIEMVALRAQSRVEVKGAT